MGVDMKIVRPLMRFADWYKHIQFLRRTWKMPFHTIEKKFPRHYSTVNPEIKDGNYVNPDESKKPIVLDANQLTHITIGCLDLSIELVESTPDTSKIIISFGEAENNEIINYQDEQLIQAAESKQSEELKQLEPWKVHSEELDHPKELQLPMKLEQSKDLNNFEVDDFVKDQKFSKELEELDRFEQSFHRTKREDEPLLENNISRSKSSEMMLTAKKFQNIKVYLPEDSIENSNVSGLSIGINYDQMSRPTDSAIRKVITNKISTDEPFTEGQPINAPFLKESPCVSINYGQMHNTTDTAIGQIITNKISTDEPFTEGQAINAPISKEFPCVGRAETQTRTLEETPSVDKAKSQAQNRNKSNRNLKKETYDHEFIRKHLFQSYPNVSDPSNPTNPECVESVKESYNANSGRLLKKIFQNLETKQVQSEKVSIVGLGQVGISTAAFILQKGLTNNLALMDLRKSWIESEALDFLHGSSFLNNPKITAGTDGRNTKNSKYVIVTVGSRPRGKSSKQHAQETTNMLKSLIPGLVEQSPDATFIIASSPSDVMAWVAHKVGKIPPHRCISLGCHLDTARFKYYISKRLNVATSCVDGYIIGEHGESSVPVWSSVTVGGIPLHKVIPNIGTKDDSQDWFKVHQQVLEGAKAITNNKGYTNWAVALSITDLLEKMQENSGRIVSVATNAKGTNCIRDPVYLSLPSMISPNGVTHICKLPLTDWETERLLKSAKILMRKQRAIKL